MQQRTIRKSVSGVGIGLHKGKPVHLRLEPMESDSGIHFYREDIGVGIALDPKSVVDTTMATVIGGNGATISTIEHFLSAVYAYGIDNLRVVLNDQEMPIMDGSAASFCMLFDESGVAEQSSGKRFIRIKKPVEVRDGDKFARLIPSDEPVFDFDIDFAHPMIGKQRHSFSFSRENYLREIARARTFGFLKEVQYLRSKNLALGGSLENAIVLDDNKILNPEGLRFEDEFARHKILDAMGDMMVIGMPIFGTYQSFAGSHQINHKLTVALLSDASAYDVVTFQAIKSTAIERSFV